MYGAISSFNIVNDLFFENKNLKKSGSSFTSFDFEESGNNEFSKNKTFYPFCGVDEKMAF